jgi:hypothetical protein
MLVVGMGADVSAHDPTSGGSQDSARVSYQATADPVLDAPADQDIQLDQSAGKLALVNLARLTPELQSARATLQDPDLPATVRSRRRD